MKAIQERADSLLAQGLIDKTAYNALMASESDADDNDPWEKLMAKQEVSLPKKKSKGVKKRKDTSLDDIALDEPMETSDVPAPPPAPEPTESWDLVPSQPDQSPRVDRVETQNPDDEPKAEDHSEGEKHDFAAGWAFLWCFRCQGVHISKFSGRVLPPWLVTSLNFKGDLAEPIVLSICCVGCNNKHRQSTVSLQEEEKKLRQAFAVIRMDHNGFGEEGLRMAEARIGRKVRMIRWDERAGCVDIGLIRGNLTPSDITVSLSLERFRDGKKGAELEIGGVAGGLF